MRELHGVMSTSPYDHLTLKQHLLLFDKIYMVGLDRRIANPKKFPEFSSSALAELLFLKGQGAIAESPTPLADLDALATSVPTLARVFPQVLSDPDLSDTQRLLKLAVEGKCVFDRLVREVASRSAVRTGIDTIPLCTVPLPEHLDEEGTSSVNNVARIVISALPTPDEGTSFEDILSFRSEMNGKRWTLRRFLKTLASKNQTEAEIQDDIEWSLSEYRKAMGIHSIKASQSFVDVWVISPLEIIENLVKFNWSRIAKGVLQVQRRKVDLLEAETKAPGRECAYVFDAQERFGPKVG